MSYHIIHYIWSRGIGVSLGGAYIGTGIAYISTGDCLHKMSKSDTIGRGLHHRVGTKLAYVNGHVKLM